MLEAQARKARHRPPVGEVPCSCLGHLIAQRQMVTGPLDVNEPVTIWNLGDLFDEDPDELRHPCLARPNYADFPAGVESFTILFSAPASITRAV